MRTAVLNPAPFQSMPVQTRRSPLYGKAIYRQPPWVRGSGKTENRPLRNEASFVPVADYVSSRRLSRVEMNALRAPLTAFANDDGLVCP